MKQGGYWLGYRPIVRCELVVPSAYSYHALQARIEQMPVLEHSDSHAPAADGDARRPSTSTEAGSGTGTDQQQPPPSSSSPPLMMMTSAAEPPKYEEAIF